MVFDETFPALGLEHAHQAHAALERQQGRAVQAVRARGSFRPLSDFTLVPVLPCDRCQDGGLRAVGTVRSRTGMQRAHVCDTCGQVRLFDVPDGVVP
jgi:hypothetical protein